MFMVQPLRSPETKAEIVRETGARDIENTFSFFAAEMKNDFTTVDFYIALCQFVFSPDVIEIRALDVREGSEDDEAVTILVRSVMKWADNAGIPRIEFGDPEVSDETKTKMSFRKDENGIWSIDLERFYKGPCSYDRK